MAYRALMLSGVPNFAFTIGYTNASWTLKADLVSEYVCRLLAHLDVHGARTVVPVRDETVAEVPLMDFHAGYVQRVVDTLPRQGNVAPWSLQAELPPRRPRDPPCADRRRRAGVRVRECRMATIGSHFNQNL